MLLIHKTTTKARTATRARGEASTPRSDLLPCLFVCLFVVFVRGWLAALLLGLGRAGLACGDLLVVWSHPPRFLFWLIHRPAYALMPHSPSNKPRLINIKIKNTQVEHTHPPGWTSPIPLTWATPHPDTPTPNQTNQQTARFTAVWPDLTRPTRATPASTALRPAGWPKPGRR